MYDFEREYNNCVRRTNYIGAETRELLDIIYSISMNEINFEYANKLCRFYIFLGDGTMAGTAIQCAEHIARVYKQLVDIEIIQEIIHSACEHTPIVYETKAIWALNMMQSLVDYDIYSLYKPSTKYASQTENQKKVFYQKGKTVNPMSFFDLSVQVFPDRPRKYVADPINSRVIIFDEYLPGKFCHHFREYVELSNRPEFNTQLIWDTVPDDGEE
jgi:hypothetical protein